MIKKCIGKTILICLMMLLFFKTKAYCVVDPSTARIKIDNNGSWNNITIGEAYLECEALNSTSSTLGTAALEVHLTTDYDYNAMAIFAVSQYGGRKNQQTARHESINGNNTGVYAGSSNLVIYTSTVLPAFNNPTDEKYKGLFDNNGNLKKYINKIDPKTGIEYDKNNNATNKKAISYLAIAKDGTAGWLNATVQLSTNVSYPCSVRRGLFGVIFGLSNVVIAPYNQCAGGRSDNSTFRPVIWN